MSKNNKPQWLLDAEKAIQEFEQTKYAKKTEGQLAKSRNAEIQRAKIDEKAKRKAALGGSKSKKRYDSEYQREMAKRGAHKGGNAAWSKLVEEHGEDSAKQIIANRMYNIQDESWKKEFHKKGAQASHAKKKADIEKTLDLIISEIPDVPFTKKELAPIMIKYGKGAGYFTSVLRYRKDQFEIVGKITQYGGATILYKKK